MFDSSRGAGANCRTLAFDAKVGGAIASGVRDAYRYRSVRFAALPGADAGAAGLAVALYSDDLLGDSTEEEVFEFAFEVPVCVIGLTALEIDHHGDQSGDDSQGGGIEVALYSARGELLRRRLTPDRDGPSSEVEIPLTEECNVTRLRVSLSARVVVNALRVCEVKPQPGAVVWEDFFDDNGGAEVGNGVAIDSGNNVYVCGAVDDGTDVDALVRKYDRDGALVLEAGLATDNNDVAMACASDRQDHLLVAGASGSDGFVGKYTSDGRALWTRNVGAQALGVTVDPEGNVTVAAERRDSGGFANAQVRSYNPDGSVRWQVSRGTPLGDDRAHAVAADERGDVVVAGQLFCDREDTFVAKYDRDGALVWDANWLATAGDDGALAVAVDSDGITWVAGYVTGAGLDGVLIKLDCRGQELLRVPIDHGELDVATGVAVGGDGSVAVSGFSLVTGGTLDAWIKKYDPSGALIWSAWLDRGANDQAFAVAIDSAGDVIGVGASTDPRTASDDLWVRKHFR